MKISKKLLTALGTIGLLSGSAAAITSCACTRSYIEAGVTDVSIVGNQKYTYFEFTLKDDIGQDQTLTCNAEGNDYFVFGDLVITNKIVSLPVVWMSETAVISKTYTQDITFICNNKDGSKAWEQTIKDCSVTYSPNITLISDSKMVTETLSDDKRTMTGVYTFKLGEELNSILELVPYITKYSEGYSIDYDNTKVEVNGKEVTFTLVVKRDTTIDVGDKFEFDLQFECVVSGTAWTYWQSNMFSRMSMSYSEKEIAIYTTDFIIENRKDESTGVTYQVLTGIKASSKAWDPNAGYNTLSIPAKNAQLWIRQVGDGTQPILNLPSTIKKIKIEGIGVQKFADKCFQNYSQIKCFDVSAITDEVQSLDTLLQFGTDSLSGWSSSGHIIWNSSISQYKKHLVKQKLWNGGLQSKDWFGITQVTNISQLREAAYIGGTIELNKDINIVANEDFTGQVNFYNSCILDLNGHTIQVTGRPIFNTPKAEFAAIGVWDCELLVCDSSTNHDGSIKAFDCSKVNYDIAEEDPDSPRPEQPPEDPKKDPGTNKYWEWLPDEKRWRIRENRTFYVRSDIPSRAKGTLEILGGKFYGNCTNIMNWNTTVYVEDGYVQADEKTPVTYKGTYAPEFHLYSVYCNENSQYIPSDSCREMLNCKEATCKSGEATFQVWGGKFFGAQAYDPLLPEGSRYILKYFDPSKSLADQVPDSSSSTGYKYADWTHTADSKTLCSVVDWTHAVTDVSQIEKAYILAIPGDLY